MCGRVQFYVPLFLTITVTHTLVTHPQRSINDILGQDEELFGFMGLVRHNRDAGISILQQELTVFAPTNQAFEDYGKSLDSDLAFYHIATGVQTMADLRKLQNISSIERSFPKLWITSTEDKIYVNNAKVIDSKSNRSAKTRSGTVEKFQILHAIDSVLDPLIRNPKYTRNAYNFMTETGKWHLDANISVAAFLHKVQQYRLAHLYDIEGANTYFIPVDSGINSYNFEKLSKQVILGHMVPSYVLFSRPTTKRLNFETMTNDDNGYIVLSLEETDGKLWVKAKTIVGNEDIPECETFAEIIKPNIPVFNGVIHLIADPIAIPKRMFKPFPYLPIMEKLATDPNLATVYEMGENTGFNKIFTTHNASFTYFVPSDFAWIQMKKNGLKFAGSDVDLLKRHLVISDYPYTMEHLLSMSTTRNFTHVELKTLGGYMRLLVLQIEKNFYIKWGNVYIKVLRPNYECTDGIVHILAAPIARIS